MLKQALFIIWKNLVFYIVLMVFLAGLLVFNEYYGSISLLSLIILAGNVQNSVFRNKNFLAAAKTRMLPLGRHLVRSIFVILVVIAISSPFIFLLDIEYAANKNYFFRILARLILVLNLTIVLSLFGTWLSAGLFGTNTSLKHAFRRGWAQPFSIGLRILMATAVPFIWLSASGLMVSAIGRQHLVARDSLHILFVTGNLIFSFSEVIGCTYISVVLARRYMEAEHIEPPPRGELLAVFA